MWRLSPPRPTELVVPRVISFILLLAILLLAALPLAARAEQHYSNGHVVHTRRAPVVAHRVVPPFKGVHVYEGRRR